MMESGLFFMFVNPVVDLMVRYELNRTSSGIGGLLIMESDHHLRQGKRIIVVKILSILRLLGLIFSSALRARNLGSTFRWAANHQMGFSLLASSLFLTARKVPASPSIRNSELVHPLPKSIWMNP